MRRRRRRKQNRTPTTMRSAAPSGRPCHRESSPPAGPITLPTGWPEKMDGEKALLAKTIRCTGRESKIFCGFMRRFLAPAAVVSLVCDRGSQAFASLVACIDPVLTGHTLWCGVTGERKVVAPSDDCGGAAGTGAHSGRSGEKMGKTKEAQPTRKIENKFLKN